MATISAAAATSDSSARGAVNISITNIDEPASNRSTINWSTQVYDNNLSTGGYSFATGNTHFIDVAGTRRGTWTGNYDFGSGVISGPAFPNIARTGSFTISHNTSTGAGGSVNGNAQFVSVDTPVGSASATPGSSITLTTFTAPSTPAAPALTRSSPGTIGITAQIPASNGSFAPQLYQYRTYDNTTSSWLGSDTYINMSTTGTYPNQTPSRTASISVTPTSQYTVYTRVANNYNVNWGYSAESSTTIAGIPSQVGQPTVSASNTNSQNINISWTAPYNGGSSITAYNVYRCDSSGNILTTLSTTATGTSFTDTSGTIGVSYTYRLEAKNAIGTGTVSSQSSIVQTPGAPSPPTFGANPPFKVGRNVTVIVSSDSLNYGKAISGYYVQYQSATTSGGTYSAWSTPQLMTLNEANQEYTFVLLPAALWYKFRVYAKNSIVNNSAGAITYYPDTNLSYTANFSPSSDGTTAMFVSAGGRRYRGAGETSPNTYQPTETAKRYGVEGAPPLSQTVKYWDLSNAKRWNGTAWVDLT